MHKKVYILCVCLCVSVVFHVFEIRCVFIYLFLISCLHCFDFNSQIYTKPKKINGWRLNKRLICSWEIMIKKTITTTINKKNQFLKPRRYWNDITVNNRFIVVTSTKWKSNYFQHTHTHTFKQITSKWVRKQQL